MDGNLIRIFIDQGHNPQGINAGAEGFGYREQDITYQVGVYLANLLREDGRFAVRLSRNTPEEVLGTSNATSLAARVNAANSWGAEYFISIHCNANENPAINGTEVYVYRDPGTAASLARDVLDGIVERMGTKDNGVRVNSSLYVLRRTRMPAILVELAYITNEQDVQKLVNDPYGFAVGIYDGILDFFDLQEP
ncbi:MAG: N-acetylmuramoyl-L-alanine amidase [Clostridia bacterium]|nr:N-acetylmuramoyl-L-alanine amidase [Clostridia bacterium]